MDDDSHNNASEKGSELHLGENGEPGQEPAGLSEVELAMLVFEKQWFKYAGAKETAVREKFDVSMTRYYQVLNALIDRPGALEADPLLVGRLRRLRVARQRQRSLRRLSDGSA